MSASRLLPVRPQETGRVLALWSVYLVLSAGVHVTDGVAQTLFLKRVGVEHLPTMFIVKALLDVLGAALYVDAAPRLGHGRTMIGILSLGAAGTAAAWLLLGLQHAALFVLLFAFSELLQTLLKVHWGVFLLDHFSGEAGARLFPVIYTGARVGAIAGGLLLGPLSRPLGPANLLLLASPLFALAIIVLLVSRRRMMPSAEVDLRDAIGPVGDVGKGLALGPRSALLRAIAAATGALVLCRGALRYRYSAILSGSLAEAELARYYGLYIASANVAGIALQLFVTSHLLAAIGLGATNVIYAIAVPLAMAALWRAPGVPAAVGARVVEHELKVAIKTPLSNLFYGGIAPERRAAARALVFGLVVPACTLGAALLLRVPRWIDAWALPMSGAFLLASLLQNRAYARTPLER